MRLLLGIDFGTSYFKAGLFDASGRLHGLGRVGVTKDSPAPGRAELPVARFWSLVREAIGQALCAAGATPADIAAVSYSSQANTFVLLDAASAPLTPLVLWTDNRADPVPADLDEFSNDAEFARRTGFVGWSAGFAVAKYRWWQQREPGTWSRLRHVLTLPDYVTFALTGRALVDASTAAFTGLYDLDARDWWPEALDQAGLRPGQLAPIAPPGAPVGPTTRAAGELAGLATGVPFVLGGLDHHVAALGSGLGKDADVSISTGTVVAAMALVSRPEPKRGCFHGPDFAADRFYRLAFDPRGAGQLEEYRAARAPDRTIEELVGLAAQPTSGLGRDVRTLLETMAAIQARLIRDVVGSAAIQRIVATGGGARSTTLLQLQADLTGATVQTPTSPERACLGAAMIASVAAGWYRDLGAASVAMLEAGRTFSPDPARHAEYRRTLARD